MTRRPTTGPDDAKGDQDAERLAEHVRAVVDAAPPLTVEQRARISAALHAASSARGRPLRPPRPST